MSTLIPKFDLKNGNATPAGAVNRDINLKLAESVSVTDFGADPTGVADSTTAIQNAIASLPATGGTLYFPSGTYITDTIVFPLWPKALYLIGNGRDSTTLVAKNANSPIIKGTTALTAFESTAHNYVYGFAFKAHASGSTGAALDLSLCSYSTFRNSTFIKNGTGAWTYGYLLDATVSCYSNLIDDVIIVNSTPITASVVQIQNHANQHYLTNFRINQSNVLKCVTIANSAFPNSTWAIYVQNCYFEGLPSTVNGVLSCGQGIMYVSGCYFENVISALDTTVSGYMSVSNCFFSIGTAYPAVYPLTWDSISNVNLTQRFPNQLQNRLYTETVLCGANDGNVDNASICVNGTNQVGITSITTLTTGYNHFICRNPNGVVGTIASTGTTTSYNTSSDYRFKDNQAPLENSGAFIDALKPKTWDWATDGTKGVGFIAHEVQEISPSTVVGVKDAVDSEGNPVMQAMEYGSAEFIANIVAELQSLRKRVAELESK